MSQQKGITAVTVEKEERTVHGVCVMVPVALLSAHIPVFPPQQWYQHDLVDHSPQRPDLTSGKNVSGRVWHCLQHKVKSESPFSSGSHHICTAKTETL